MNNSIMKIHPYKHEGYWVFDDKDTGLVKEPFVCGMPEIIDLHVDYMNNANDGFTIIFSDSPFPGHNLTLKRLREEHDGNWYKMEFEVLLNESDEWEGWLCPALLKYFDEAPDRIYAKFEEKK